MKFKIMSSAALTVALSLCGSGITWAADEAADQAVVDEISVYTQINAVLRESVESRDMTVQGMALSGLAEQGDKEAIKRAAELLLEENWNAKQYGLLILGNKDDKAFYPAISESLDSFLISNQALALLDQMPAKVRNKVLTDALKKEADVRPKIFQKLATLAKDTKDEKDALKILEGAVIKPPTSEVRGEALTTLAAINTKGARDILFSLYKSKDQKVRELAKEPLLTIDDPRVLPILDDMLKSKDELEKMKGAKMLAQLGKRDKCIGILREGVKTKDVEIRLLAAQGIAILGDRIGASSLAPIALDTRFDERLNTAAIDALGRSGDPAHLEQLRQAVTMDFIHIRTAAVRAMGELGDKEAIGDLGRLIIDGNSDVRREAAIALGKIGGAQVIPFLQRAVDNEINKDVKMAAIEAIGNTGDRAGLQALQGLLLGYDREMKSAAMDALIKVGGKDAAFMLQVAVDPRDPEILSMAVGAICSTDDEVCLRVLKPNFNHVNPNVVEKLGTLSDKGRAYKFLTLFMEEGNTAQRERALSLLLTMGEPGLEIIRKSGINNADRSIARNSIGAMARLNDPKSVQAFVDGTKSDDQIIRAISAEVLGRIGTNEHEETLRVLLDDRIPGVRVTAARSLNKILPPEKPVRKNAKRK